MRGRRIGGGGGVRGAFRDLMEQVDRNKAEEIAKESRPKLKKAMHC